MILVVLVLIALAFFYFKGVGTQSIYGGPTTSNLAALGIKSFTSSPSGVSISCEGILNGPPVSNGGGVIQLENQYAYGDMVARMDSNAIANFATGNANQNWASVQGEKNYSFWLLNKYEVNQPQIYGEANIPSSGLTDGFHDFDCQFKVSDFASASQAQLIENDGPENGINFQRRSAKQNSCSGVQVACTGSFMFCDWFTGYNPSGESPCPDPKGMMSKEFRLKYWNNFNPQGHNTPGGTFTSDKIRIYVNKSANIIYVPVQNNSYSCTGGSLIGNTCYVNVILNSTINNTVIQNNTVIINNTQVVVVYQNQTNTVYLNGTQTVYVDKSVLDFNDPTTQLALGGMAVLGLIFAIVFIR